MKIRITSLGRPLWMCLLSEDPLRFPVLGCLSDPGSLRLVNGYSELEGRVEVCLNGFWASLCTFDQEIASRICIDLGHSKYGKKAAYTYTTELYYATHWNHFLVMQTLTQGQSLLMRLFMAVVGLTVQLMLVTLGKAIVLLRTTTVGQLG